MHILYIIYTVYVCVYTETTLRSITNEYLCSLTDTPEHMIRLYKAFLTENGITNYTPSLELQMKMNNSLKQLTKCE